MSDTTTPYVSDEQIKNEKVLTIQENSGRTLEVLDFPLSPYEVRDLYEAHLSEVIRERDEALSTLKYMEPVTYVRQGPPIQMQDVLLACGELNEREQVAVRWVLAKINALPPYTPPAPSELDEADAVDAILNFREMRMTLHEAVKWLHDEHTENCNTLRAPIMKHRLGLGGERLAAIAANYIEQSESAKASQPSPWISVGDRLPEDDKRVLLMHRPSGNSWVSYRTIDCNTGEGRWFDESMPTHWMPIPPTPEVPCNE